MNKWIIVYLCGLLVACSHSQDEKSDKENSYRMDFESLIEKGNIQEIKLNEWGTESHYVSLGINDSIEIKSIRKIIMDADTLFVFHSDRISLFDLNGKYLYDIGKMGSGTDEYSRLLGIIMRNDTFFIQNGNYDLVRYNRRGEFCGKIFTPQIRHMNDIYPLPHSDIFLGYVHNINGQKNIRFVFFRDTMILNTVPNMEKLEKVSPSTVVTFPSEMRPFDGTISAFKELFNDTIFQVNSDYALLPYAIVDLGKYKATKEFVFSCTPEMLMKKGFDVFDGKVALSAIGEKDDIIYLAHYNIDNPYTFSYDKVAKQAYYQKIVYPDNPYGFKECSTFVPHFISADGKYLIDYELTMNGGNPVIVLVER